MSRLNAKVVLGPSDQKGPGSEVGLQEFHIDIPAAITSAWIKQELWDKMSREEQATAITQLSYTLESAHMGWISNWVLDIEGNKNAKSNHR